MKQHTKLQLKGKLGDKTAPKAASGCWLGIDLGDRWSEICQLDAEGNVTERARVQTTPAAFAQRFSPLTGVAVAIETGVHSSWASRVLTDCGLIVTVANAREVRKIHQSHRKNDKADAEILARMLRADRTLLSPIEHRSAQAQADIAVLRARDAVVRARSKLINSARGLTKAMGYRLPSCGSDAFAHRVIEHVPALLHDALAPLVEAIATMTTKIRDYDRHLETLARERYPQTALLSQVGGVGPITALAYVLTLERPQRFAHSRDVGPYLGLVPRQYDSGDHQSQLPISKAGNPYLRRLLVGSAQYILGPFGKDCQLRRYGERLQQRGGKNAKKRAIVAVARKLAVLLHHLWATGAVYDALYADQPERAA